PLILQLLGRRAMAGGAGQQFGCDGRLAEVECGGSVGMTARGASGAEQQRRGRPRPKRRENAYAIILNPLTPVPIPQLPPPAGPNPAGATSLPLRALARYPLQSDPPLETDGSATRRQLRAHCQSSRQPPGKIPGGSDFQAKLRTVS